VAFWVLVPCRHVVVHHFIGTSPLLFSCQCSLAQSSKYSSITHQLPNPLYVSPENGDSMFFHSITTQKTTILNHICNFLPHVFLVEREVMGRVNNIFCYILIN
jgi:hypothetical protein